VQLGEIEHAANIATHMTALAARTSSVRTDSRIHHIAKLLGPYRGTASVADFYDAYQSTPDVSRLGEQTKSSLSWPCVRLVLALRG